MEKCSRLFDRNGGTAHFCNASLSAGKDTLLRWLCKRRALHQWYNIYAFCRAFYGDQWQNVGDHRSGNNWTESCGYRKSIWSTDYLLLCIRAFGAGRLRTGRSGYSACKIWHYIHSCTVKWTYRGLNG